MSFLAVGLLFLNLGSTYVPLDNWVYPAFERLNALGYAPDAEGLAKPWTRAQCLVLADEAADIASRRSTKLSAGTALNEEALHLISALQDEFASRPKNVSGVRIESIYTRLLAIAGPPLQDSYHFGQTLANDFGRPYGRRRQHSGGFFGLCHAESVLSVFSRRVSKRSGCPGLFHRTAQLHC